MKNKKYRSMMVTPAFVKARERKERNDISYGRIFPVSREKPVSTPLGKSTSAKYATSESRGKIVSAPSTVHSAPLLKYRSNSRECLSEKEIRPRPGNHFLSWKIPERLMGSEKGERQIALQVGPIRKSADVGMKTKGISALGKRESSRNSQDDLKNIIDLPNVAATKKTESKCSSREDVDELVHDFAKEWLNKYDKEDRRIAEELLKTPARHSGADVSLKPLVLLSKARPISNASSARSLSNRSDMTRLTHRTNILHRTSSVAWRRDSSWLKPTKISYQSWHGLPSYAMKPEVPNVSALCMQPHRKLDSSFVIHPEWGVTA